MPTDAENFEEFLSTEFLSTTYAGDDEKILAFLTMAENFIEAYQNSDLTIEGSPAPYVNIADDPDINACAYLYDNSEGIAFFSGCVGVLERFFNHILAHPQTFPNLGNPSLETIPVIPYTLTQTSTNESMIEPQDTQRQNQVSNLLRFALHFLIFHEIAHFRLGHNRLQSNGTGNTFFQELNTSGNHVPDEIILAQTLEMNADGFAVAEGLHSVEIIVNSGVTHIPGLDEQAFLRETFGTWLYAVCAMFRLFALDIPFELEDIAAEEHPPARVRLMWVIQTVQRHANLNHFALNAEETYHIAEAVALQLENDIATITGEALDTRGIMLSTSPEVDAHLDVLRARYDEISSDLQQVSYSNALIIN